MSTKIAVSIGHQAGDPGKDIEYPNNMMVADLLYGLFSVNGFVCEQFSGNLVNKVKAINAFKPVVAIECHFNQLEWPHNPKNFGGGYEVCIHKDSIDGRKLAAAVLEQFKVKLPFNRRGTGVQERDNLYFLKHTHCPALIIEPLFLDNPVEATFLKMSLGHEFIAEAVYLGVVTYLS